MARVRLTADVDPELRRQVKIAAASVDKSVSEWVESALKRELQRERTGDLADEEGVYLPPPGVKPRGSRNPVKLRGGKTMAETVIEDRGDW